MKVIHTYLVVETFCIVISGVIYCSYQSLVHTRAFSRRCLINAVAREKNLAIFRSLVEMGTQDLTKPKLFAHHIADALLVRFFREKVGAPTFCR